VIDAGQRVGRPVYGDLEALVAEQAALIETLRARIGEQDRVIAELRGWARRSANERDHGEPSHGG
jgi:hypothetical protein